MKNKLTAFALVDLLVVAAVAVVLVSLAVPALSRARELSKRSVCGVNLAGIGAAAKVYADSNKEQWMIPPFRQLSIDNYGIDYTNDSATQWDPGDVGEPNERRVQTTSGTPLCPNCGSDSLSVTRAYWMLVRSGDTTVKQFICPSNPDDLADPTEVIDLYYDFTGYGNISYGYQVPFGPRDTQPREGADPRKIFAADKGPWQFPNIFPVWTRAGEDGGSIQLDEKPWYWRPFNSYNHGGGANGEGQNVLFADGHTSFARIPAVGIDNDNIYTLMTNEWSVSPFNRIYGHTPYEPPTNTPYPGQNTFGTGAGKYSSTDSLIYP